MGERRKNEWGSPTAVRDERDALRGSGQQDLLRANLYPRAHALGGEGTAWGRVPLDGAHARGDVERDGVTEKVRFQCSPCAFPFIAF